MDEIVSVSVSGLGESDKERIEGALAEAGARARDGELPVVFIEGLDLVVMSACAFGERFLRPQPVGP